MNKNWTTWIVSGVVALGLALIIGSVVQTRSNNNVVIETSKSHDITVVLPTKTVTTLNNTETTVKVESVNIDFDRSIQLFGEVTEESVASVVAQIQRFQDSNKPIYLLIASPGGSVFAGEQVLSAMESSRAPVYTICTSLCASMAAIIHQYGTERLAYDRSILMFHDAAGGLQGEVKKMHSMLTMVERKIERVDRYVAKRSNMTYEQFMDMHKYDLWIDAADAKQAGLVDKLIKVTAPRLGNTGPSAESLLKNFNKSNNYFELE